VSADHGRRDQTSLTPLSGRATLVVAGHAAFSNLADFLPDDSNSSALMVQAAATPASAPLVSTAVLPLSMN
jgi:hypothetical protein